jgi:hypothetical protein
VPPEYSSNPQEDDNTINGNTDYNKAPDCPRKRQVVQLLFKNRDFPALPGSNPPTPTQATSSMVTQALPNHTSIFEAKLQAIKSRLQMQINTI